MVFVHILLTQFPFLQFNYHKCLARHTTFRPLYSGGPSIFFFDGIGAIERCSSKWSYAWTPSSSAARSSSLSLISWVRATDSPCPPVSVPLMSLLECKNHSAHMHAMRALFKKIISAVPMAEIVKFPWFVRCRSLIDNLTINQDINCAEISCKVSRISIRLCQSGGRYLYIVPGGFR